MLNLTYYPKLPVLPPATSLTVLKRFGFSAGNIAEYTGASTGIVGKWLRNAPMTPSSTCAVSELTYRAYIAHNLGMMPPASVSMRERRKLLRDALTSEEVSLRLATVTAADLPITPAQDAPDAAQ